MNLALRIIAFLALAALIAGTALARSEGIYNPSSNAVGDYQGIDSNKPATGSTLACSYSPVTTGTQSVAYTGATPAASGGTPAYTFSETGALPTGLTINAANGVISGTPSVSGTFAGIQVAVTDSLSAAANCGSPFTLVISAPAFQGAGDIFTTSPYAAYSCTEAYTAAYAATLGAACDVVDTSTGLVTCTYHFQANGLVNPSECTGTSCATACRVAKAYDQTGNGRHATQAALANMPGLTFSSSPTGTLPVIDCTVGTNPNLATAAQSAQVQPLAAFAVMNRTGAVQAGDLFGTVTSNLVLLQASASANLVGVQSSGGAFLTATASDAAWHAVGTLANGNATASAVNVDGSDTTGAAGTTGIGNTDVLRICRAVATQYTGRVAEITVWAAATTPTNRNSLSTNAHSAGRYNF